jgi:hypothetical protein
MAKFLFPCFSVGLAPSVVALARGRVVANGDSLPSPKPSRTREACACSPIGCALVPRAGGRLFARSASNLSFERDRRQAALSGPLRASGGPSTQTCAPGMARYFIGESPMARFSQSRRQGEGQGRRREAGSGGSPIQSCGAMNKNRI